jgi:AGCS family alanine or glycine:cation symporter
MARLLFGAFALFLFSEATQAAGFSEFVSDTFGPISAAFSALVFYTVNIGGVEFPLIIAWLVAGGIFCSVYLRVLTPSNLRLSFKLLRGDFASPEKKEQGQVSHFQALTTALSGTVGVGNLGHGAIAITLGGPGAILWMVVGGLLGASMKCAECILGVQYREEHEDGSVSGGPMYYLSRGLKARGFDKGGRFLGAMYALFIVIGCLGIGNMFQANQAFTQLQVITGGDTGFLADAGVWVGLLLAVLFAIVVVGGITAIGRVTSKLVPFMAGIYLVGAFAVILGNIGDMPGVIGLILSEAFNPTGIAGGMYAIIAIGFQRAVFSNEAGIGSASIAHSAVKTDEKVTEGFVGLLEPLIDTVLICPLTGFVILLTIYDPAMVGAGVQGVELTSRAYESIFSGAPYILAGIIVLFAFSTMISWGYYGQKGWTYLAGNSQLQRYGFYLLYCIFIVIGCTIDLSVVIDFSDAIVFLMAIPNIVGLYIFAPEIRAAILDYRNRVKSGAIRDYRKG